MEQEKKKTERIIMPHVAKRNDGLCYCINFGREFLKHPYCIKHKNAGCYTVNYVASGEGVIVAGDEAMLVKRGDLCFFHPEDNTVFSATSNELEVWFFHVVGLPAKSVFEQFAKAEKPILADFSYATVQTFYTSLSALVHPATVFEVSKLVFSFLMDILRANAVQSAMPYPKLIRDTLSYCHTHEGATVQELATALGYNSVYLERSFKQHVGVSLKQHLLQTKFHVACHKLITTDQSVEEIALSLGYSNSMGLLFLFRKLAGISPLQFRKQHDARKHHASHTAAAPEIN